MKVSGDKYFATRVIILSSISCGTTTLLNCPEFSSDIQLCLSFPTIIGAKKELINQSILITGTKGKIPHKFNIFCGDSGTLTRFILSIGVLFKKKIQITLGDTMKKRPIHPFLIDLKRFGGHYEETIDFINILGSNESHKVYNFTSKSISSQLISGTILFGGMLPNSIGIKLSNPDPVSKNYIKLTQKCVSLFGGKTKEKSNFLTIHPTNYKNNGIITIPDDPCSAAYLILLSILLKWKIYFNFTKKNIAIGEWKVLYILRRMGCVVKIHDTHFSVHADAGLTPISEDLKDFPDNAPTILFLCSLSKGISKICNISHIKYKESNRLIAMKEFYSKMNIKFEEIDSSIYVHGNPTFLKNVMHDDNLSKSTSILLDANYDHRISIVFLIASIIFPNLWVKKIEGIEKSFPDFWSILKELNIQHSEKVVN